MSPSEKRKLAVILKQDPEMQKKLNQLEQISGLLDRVSQVEPPSHLSKHIMNSIDVNRYAKKATKPAHATSRKRILAWMEPRLAMAFGMGVVTVLLILIMTQDHQIQISKNTWQDFYGTIGISEKLDFTSKEIIPIDVYSIHGSIHLQKAENLVGLEIALKAEDNFQLQVNYDPKTLLWNGLKPLDGLNLGIETGENFIKITPKTEMQMFLFFIQTEEPESPLNLQIWKSKELVWQGKTGNPVPVNQ